MLLRTRSIMLNAPTTSVLSDDNNNELVNTIRVILKEELKEHEKKLNPNYKTLMNV